MPAAPGRRLESRVSAHGTVGHTAGADVLRAPTNRSTRSLLAVPELPLDFAGVLAHQRNPLPIVNRTATWTCGAWSSAYGQLARPPRMRSRLPRTITRVIASLELALRYL